MEPQMDKKPTKNLLDKITPEDLEKIEAHRASTEGAYPVDNEWMLLAEFGKAYGWDAYKDARDDRISSAEMLTLIEANRKLEAVQLYKDSQSSLIGTVSAKSKKPGSTFRSLTKGIIKQMKVKE
jgi:hypothetical protein